MRCPRQYELRYIQGLIRPPGAALVLGHAFHEAMAGLAMEKANGAKVEQDQAADLFVDAFDAEAEGEVDWGEEKPGQIKDAGVAMTTAGARTWVAPLRPWEIAGVEAKFDVLIPDYDVGKAVPFTGFRDLVLVGETGDLTVVDYKTSSRKWPSNRVDKEIQPLAYALPEYLLAGVVPPFRFDVVVRPSRDGEVRTQSFPVQPDQAAVEWWLDTVRRAYRLVQAGVFMPNPTGWWCSPKWCGYYDLCRGRA